MEILEAERSIERNKVILQLHHHLAPSSGADYNGYWNNAFEIQARKVAGQ